jgi:carboxymethylenebutenolidase
MTSSHVDIPTPDGVADAYLVHPDAGGRPPGVLLLMDAFGLRPRLEEMADRMAAEGYAVLVPNLLYRSGRAPVLPFPDMTEPDSRAEFLKQLRPMAEQLTTERIAADGAAYLDELATVTDGGPVGITGYCMGARVGWRIATAFPERVAALAGFHGGYLVTDEPDSAHRSAGDLRAEVYFGHADQDPSMTAADIETLDAALEAAGVVHTSEVYEGASHGYTMSDTPVYDEAGAERHFAALFALLGRTLAR